MDKESLKILAMVECLLIWDRMAETGDALKQPSIDYLFSKRMISSRNYDCGCPFCEYFRKDQVEECRQCLWPGNRRKTCRCTDFGSLFERWASVRIFDGVEITKKAAQKVLDMLLQIPMD